MGDTQLLFMEIKPWMIPTLCIITTIASSVYAYNTLIKADLSTPVDDLITSNETRISNLEVGIKNSQEKVRACQSTLYSNKKFFDEYVDKTKGYVSKANDELAFLEGKILQKELTIQRKQDKIESLKQIIREYEEERRAEEVVEENSPI